MKNKDGSEIIVGFSEVHEAEYKHQKIKNMSLQNKSYDEQKEALSKFGKVDVMCQSVYNYEFRLSDGFSSNIDNTLAFMATAKEIAGNRYNKIKEFVTEDDSAVLILTLQSA